MECGTPTAAGPGRPAPTPTEPTGASSRRTTSILFGDLVGFTTLSESRDAEDVRELLGRYFDECRQIVARYGGTVEKFIGDAVMAVWGVPTAHEDDAERAVRAGLELVAAVREFGEDVGAPTSRCASAWSPARSPSPPAPPSRAWSPATRSTPPRASSRPRSPAASSSTRPRGC